LSGIAREVLENECDSTSNAPVGLE
jgi:hypothetical protein